MGVFRTHAVVRLATAVLGSYQVFFDRRRAELSRAEPQRIMRERRRQTAGAARSSLHLPAHYTLKSTWWNTTFKVFPMCWLRRSLM